MAFANTDRAIILVYVERLDVGRFGTRTAGAGGFINISQNAREVLYLDTFTSGGLQVGCRDGELHIVKQGNTAKFFELVGHPTFSGKYALRRGQRILNITERAVFELDGGGLRLIEIAPGIDLGRYILSKWPSHHASRRRFRPWIPGRSATRR